MDAHITALARHMAQLAPQARITLFGSRARNTNSPYSDVDLAFEGAITDAQWTEILRASDIDDEKAFPTLLKIDVIRYETADKNLQNIIRNEGKVLYEC